MAARTVPASKSNVLNQATIFLVLVLGLLLRLWGIGFGLPDLFHADEPIVVNHALAFGAGDLNPHFFKIPPLVSYLLFLCYGLYFLIARGGAMVTGIEDFQNLFLSDPSSFYLIARVVFGALVGTLTIYLVYRLFKKFFSVQHALISSFFLAIAFLHVRDSHYIYVDIPLLLILVGSFFFIFRVLERGFTKDYVWFGVLAGTAVATKYNGVFIVIPFLVAHFVNHGVNISSILSAKVFAAALIALVTFGALNPFSWLDYTFFINELVLQKGSTGFMGFTHHLTYSLSGGLGVTLLLVALAGVVLAILHGDRKRRVICSFVISYYVLLGMFSQPYDRYVLPLIPFLVFFAADVHVRVNDRFKLPPWMAQSLVLLVVVPSLCKVYLSNELFVKADVRTEAREWIEKSIPSGSKIALDVPFFMPRLKHSMRQLQEKKDEIVSDPNSSRAQLKRLDLMIEEARRNPEGRYDLYFISEIGERKEGFLFSKPVIAHDIQGMERAGIEFVCVTEDAKKTEPTFYDELQQNGALVKSFSPYREGRPEGPMDRQPMTGGSFLFRDLISRSSNGQAIEIYRLS